MKIAVWCVTRKGAESSKIIGDALNAEIFTLEKFQVSGCNSITNLRESLKEKFDKYDFHIFVMASGIAIRTIARELKNKLEDPGVILIDENLTFAISLLSGHVGGANEFTNEISKKLNLIPIITTSSDINGKIAVDTLSEKLNSRMRSLEEAKEVTSLIVDNKEVNLYLPTNIKTDNIKNNPEGVIIYSNKKNIKITQLYPKNIVVGIGCRSGKSFEDIYKGLQEALELCNISLKSIKHIATVDIKKNEIGIIELAKLLKVQLKIVSNAEICQHEERFKKSQFVKESIGVSSVSAPTAYITSNKKGKFLLEKHIYSGVTVSIYEESE